ncbi:MAG: sodium/proton antiporter NhaB [Candidatus Anaerobiospirillum merdipullorum]|uniref:Na(+)/H(+) antiporter NhaB n=1 Tax=Candidatus Anaerobiospirillum merdipullorum TaxID=2838450 RepID=A0A9E2KNQ4_9GAMM|nr:sodium/proton antiporter NhaB [Candidatus Anaerobiospirillum merdipullorum]
MASLTYTKAFGLNFMGSAPVWYKLFILACLIINPVVTFAISPVLAGWMLVAEFIFTLSMALKCYPLQPGGLLTIEACFIGLCDMEHVREEIGANLEVILLLMFMVAGIHFVRDLLMYVFTKLLVKVRSHHALALIFCLMGAFLSAFLDALTVLAVVITICMGMYALYHNTICGDAATARLSDDRFVPELSKKDLDDFRAFLRSILMHAAVGTALGGVCTLVGEPQNIIVGGIAGWDFAEFALRVSPVSMPTLFCGLLTCFLIEHFKLFGFGTPMPDSVHKILAERDKRTSSELTKRDKLKLAVQAVCCVWLIVGLAFHLAAVGLIGLSIIIFATAFCGVTSEEELGQAFTESLPFCSLLCVFFAVVTVISEQQLFNPLIAWVLSSPPEAQLPIFYMANGILSSVSDNVFVATIYIEQVYDALLAGTISGEQFDHLAIAINAGTNLPSVATPNGQAAFLFLLTSALAPLIRLSYVKMLWMALPYTIVLTLVGLLGTTFLLPDVTQFFIDNGWIISGDIAHAAEVAGAAAAH